MNYTELQGAIIAYTENREATFASMVPVFVRQAEKRIYNFAQLPNFRKNCLGGTASGSQHVQLPSDFLAPFSLAVVDDDGEHQFLLNKDVSFIREAYPDQTYQGLPRYYALFDHDTALVGPTPDKSYQLELHYYYYPESIVSAGTTWLGNNYDTALLYGSLIEAYTFMKGEPDLLELYTKRYDEAVAQLKGLGDAKDRIDTYRSGQLRLPVQ